MQRIPFVSQRAWETVKLLFKMHQPIFIMRMEIVQKGLFDLRKSY